MIVKTTLNINKKYSDKIKSIAAEYSLTCSEIINMLLIKLLSYNEKSLRIKNTTQYQAPLRDENECWYTLHVSINAELFEKMFDLKKLFRKSLSLFVSFAFNKYMDQIIEELENDEVSDNYHSNYIIINSNNDCSNYITILWHIPDQQKLKNIYQTHSPET